MTPTPVADPVDAIRSSWPFRIWRALTLVPMVVGVIVIVGSLGFVGYVYATDPGSFDGLGGLALLLLVVAAVAGFVVVLACWFFLAVAKRSPKVGAGLSAMTSLACAVWVLFFHQNWLALTLAVWTLAHLISAICVITSDPTKATPDAPLPAPPATAP